MFFIGQCMRCPMPSPDELGARFDARSNRRGVKRAVAGGLGNAPESVLEGPREAAVGLNLHLVRDGFGQKLAAEGLRCRPAEQATPTRAKLGQAQLGHALAEPRSNRTSYAHLHAGDWAVWSRMNYLKAADATLERAPRSLAETVVGRLLSWTRTDRSAGVADSHPRQSVAVGSLLIDLMTWQNVAGYQDSARRPRRGGSNARETRIRGR